MAMSVMNIKYQHNRCVTSTDASQTIVNYVSYKKHFFRNLFSLQETGEPDMKELVS